MRFTQHARLNYGFLNLHLNVLCCQVNLQLCYYPTELNQQIGQLMEGIIAPTQLMG